VRITNLHDHPLSTAKGTVGYHRYACFESLGRPSFSPCHWCGYVLPWKSGIISPLGAVVNVDHLNDDKHDNRPENLVPACAWCNANRSWAEDYPEFWEMWRRWLRDTPPPFRPSLPNIAKDFGITLDLLGDAED
jgi:hypothetical protein